MRALIGFLVGSGLVGGTWAFVESQQVSPSWRNDNGHRVWIEPPPAAPQADQPVLIEKPSRGPRTARSSAPPRTEAVKPVLVSPPPLPYELRDDAVAPPRTASQPQMPGAPPDSLRITVATGGGVETSLSSTSGVATQWDLRVGIEPWEHYGFELGYVGTRSPAVNTTSFEALARWYPQARQPGRYYLHAGVGWRRFHQPMNTDVATLPVGVGFTYSRGRWHADTRFTVRPTTRRGLHTLGGAAHVGMTF